MDQTREDMLLVGEMVVHAARSIAPMVTHMNTPIGNILAVTGAEIYAKALDLAIAATGSPPHKVFELLCKWGVCVPTDQDGFDGTVAEFANGNTQPRPCVVIHEHGDYNLVHCRRGTNGGIFCLVHAKTGEGIEEDVMHRMVDDLIENLPDK